MSTNYDSLDLVWDFNGDFNLGKDGDFLDTSSDYIQSLVQEIRTVSASALDDWLEHPSYGAGLDDFVGEANTRDTAEKIRLRLSDALVLNNVVKQEDLEIKMIPVGLHTLMAIIKVKALPTGNNSLEDNLLVISMIFDYQERGIYFTEG